MKVQFFGDVSEQHSPVRLETLDHDADVVIFNLEGPICSAGPNSASLPPKAGPRISSTYNVFENFGPDDRQIVAAVSNNHFWDFGSRGVESTLRYASETGTHIVGQTTDPLIIGAEWVVVSVMEPTFGSEALGGDARVLGPETFTQVSHMNRAGFKVIVLIHGGSEDCFLINPQSVRTYRALCDLGASVVWATHSHVPQITEVYGDSFICYGAGNTLVDLERWGSSGFGTFSRSLVLNIDSDGVCYESFLSQVMSFMGEDRLVRVLSEEDLSVIQDRDLAMRQLMDDPQMHEMVWLRYAQIWFEDYGFGAYLKGALLDLANRFKPFSLWSRLRYPLSIDTLMWPTNRDLVCSALATRYGLRKLPESAEVEDFLSLLG